MHDGTQCGKEIWPSAVGIKVSISGVMSGKETLGKKRWLNVLVCLQVSLISKSVFASHLLTPTEIFETRDIVWARDGKGLILFGKDQFCCAFEVREEDDHVVLGS
jgi:hypothetical protein